MDVSYTHELYVFKMSHFLRTVCIKYTRHEVLIFKKKLTVIIFCNEQIFFLLISRVFDIALRNSCCSFKAQ